MQVLLKCPSSHLVISFQSTQVPRTSLIPGIRPFRSIFLAFLCHPWGLRTYLVPCWNKGILPGRITNRPTREPSPRGPLSGEDSSGNLLPLRVSMHRVLPMPLMVSASGNTRQDSSSWSLLPTFPHPFPKALSTEQPGCSTWPSGERRCSTVGGK